MKPTEDNDFLGDLRPILADDLASFVPKIQKGRGLRTAADPRDDYVGQEARRFVAEMKADAADTPKCTAMAVVIAERMTGDRGDQRAGVLAAVRFDERGHQGLGAALDELWSVRAKSPRDFWRLVEGAKEEVLDSPSPTAEKGCNCPGTFDVVKRIGPKLTEAEEEGYEPDDEVDTPEEASEIRKAQVAARVNAIEIDEEARRIVARRKSANRPAIADGWIDWADLDSVGPPTMLMESLIPDDSIGFLSGRSGAYKSFLAVSWSCCVAGGLPWLGDPAFAVRRKLKTGYVAAEGAKGAAARARAWGDANGVDLTGQWLLYPRPILLNDTGQAEELAEYVKANGIEFLVVDTYRRSSAGSEENSSSDFALIFEAVARIRDELGCSVQFLDHTGHSGDGRPVGAEGKIASADYVLSTMYVGPTREPSVQRELFVIKLKDEESSGRWPIRLRDVPGRPMPVIEVGEVGAVDGSAEFWGDREWWTSAVDLPDCVAELKGRGASAAFDIFRVLAYVNAESGLTRDEIKGALKAAPLPYVQPSRSAVLAGLALLEREGITEPGGTTARLRLTPRALPKVVRLA